MTAIAPSILAADFSRLGELVREVAAAHGGQAWLDDVPHGASFVIEIPWQPSS